MRGEAGEAQLGFFFGLTEITLAHHLGERLGRPVSLVLTENSTSMLSARARSGVLCVRLHRMFLAADHAVLEDIVSFLKHKKGKMTHFREFVRGNPDQLGKRPANRVTERTSGKYHDLRELYREINEEYFGGMIDAAITWGAQRPRFAVRKRTFGSYSERSNTIRINPVLDKKTVPRYYVAFVVYHEMLHASTGILRQGKRRSIHSRQFRSRERLFKDYERAVAWERTGHAAR
jgi:predicted metal-dependent hydrolase